MFNGNLGYSPCSCCCRRAAGSSPQHTGLPQTWRLKDGSPQLSHHSPRAEGAPSRCGEGADLKWKFGLSRCSSLFFYCLPLQHEGTPDIPAGSGGLRPLLPEDCPARGTKAFLSQTSAYRTHPTCATYLV